MHAPMFRSHPKSTPKAEFQRLKICCGYTDTYIVTSQDAKKQSGVFQQSRLQLHERQLRMGLSNRSWNKSPARHDAAIQMLNWLDLILSRSQTMFRNQIWMHFCATWIVPPDVSEIERVLSQLVFKRELSDLWVFATDSLIQISYLIFSSFLCMKDGEKVSPVHPVVPPAGRCIQFSGRVASHGKGHGTTKLWVSTIERFNAPRTQAKTQECSMMQQSFWV